GTYTITSAATGGERQLYLPGTPTAPASSTSMAIFSLWLSARTLRSWKRRLVQTDSPTLVQMTTRKFRSGSKASTSWVTSFNPRAPLMQAQAGFSLGLVLLNTEGDT